jgi:hypothetical protein
VMVMNVNSARIFDDEDFGRVSFEGWEGLNDYEKLAAECFEEGLEYTFSHTPPVMMLEPSQASNDLTVGFWVQALGDDKGPCWAFSMKDTFSAVAEDYSEEDQSDILKSLEAVTEYVRDLIRKGKP